MWIRKDELDAERLRNLQFDVHDISGINGQDSCFTLLKLVLSTQGVSQNTSAFNCFVWFLGTVSTEIAEWMNVSVKN